MPAWIDTHCHLDAPEFSADAAGVRERAAAAGVVHCILPAVEVGNFAALDSRRAKTLMSFLPAYLLERSARWIVFTATASIRAILSAMGAHCLEVGAADGACVAGGADEWGRYYSNDPRVMAGFLPSARRIPKLWRSCRGD